MTEELNESQFTSMREDFFEHYRHLARQTIYDLDPSRADDRERFRTAQEVYDLAADLSNVRWIKVRRWAVAALNTAEPAEPPENLLDCERAFVEAALQIGRKSQGELQ
jgi:hypothetical protein